MRYVYPDLKALRFRYKGGAINCFWKDLLGFSIKRIGLYEISFNYARFVIFWKNFFEGVKRLFTDGKVKKSILRNFPTPEEELARMASELEFHLRHDHGKKEKE